MAVRELYYQALSHYLDNYKERRFGNEDEHFHQIMSGFLKVVIVSGRTPEWAAQLLKLDVDEAVQYYNSPEIQGDLLPQLRELLALKAAFCNIKCNKPMLQLYSHMDVYMMGTTLTVERKIGTNIFQHLPQSILQIERGQMFDLKKWTPGFRKWKSDASKKFKEAFGTMSGPVGDLFITHCVFTYGRTAPPSDEEVEEFEMEVARHQFNPNKINAFVHEWYNHMLSFDADLHMFGLHAEQCAMELMLVLIPENTTITQLEMLMTVILSSAFNRDNYYALHYALCERYKKSADQIYTMVNACHEAGVYFDPTSPEMIQHFSEYPLKFLINGYLIPLTREQANTINAKKDTDSEPNGWPWNGISPLSASERRDLDKRLLTAFRRGSLAPNHDEEAFIVSSFAELRSHDIAQLEGMEIHDAMIASQDNSGNSPCSSTSIPASLRLISPTPSDDLINGVKKN